MTNRWTPWEELGTIVEEPFHVWPPDFPERRWARQAWWILTKEEMTYGGSEAYFHSLVVARFLALAGIYLDFCALAWNEARVPLYADWAQRMGFDPECMEDIAWDEWLDQASGAEIMAWYRLDYDASLVAFLEAMRRRVLEPLAAHHRGTRGLFCSLWRSAPPERQAKAFGLSDSPLQPSSLSDADIIRWDVPKCREATRWLAEGCPQVLR